MDQDLLAIRLSAYSLGELDPVLRAEIEQILAANEAARDQVMRVRAVAKSVKELLPTQPDDVHPMTPAEYHARKAVVAQAAPVAAHAAVAVAPAAVPVAPRPAVAAARPVPAPAPPPSTSGIGSVTWVLLACCAALLALLLYTQVKKPKQTGYTEEQYQQALGDRNAMQTQVDGLRNQVADRTKESEAAKAALAESQVSGQATAAELTKVQQEVAVKNAALDDAHAQLAQRLAQLEQAQTHYVDFAPVYPGVPQTLPKGRVSQLAAVTAALAAGQKPLPTQVDSADLIQGLDYGYAKPPTGLPLALGLDAAACPWAMSHQLVRITAVAGDQDVDLTHLRVEFNPQRVGRCRLIGWEDGGRDLRVLKAGESLTLLYEITAPLVEDPAAVLRAQRDAKVAAVAAKEKSLATAPSQDAALELTLQIKFDKLSIRDLDKAIVDAEKGTKGDAPHFVMPTQYTAAALSGEWVQVRIKLGERTLSVSAKDMAAFPVADQNFRLAATAAVLGQVLRGSPYVGKADLRLAREMSTGLEGPAAEMLKSWISGAEQAK